jgi:hypothetical protein
MNTSERLTALGVLAFAVGALCFLFAPVASLSPVVAQQTTTNATSPEVAPGSETATSEEPGDESSSNETTTTEAEHDTFTVRDSVFALLADQTIPASGFIHLYDTTPYSIRNGHVAAKIPCDDNSTPMLNILVGVAPELAPVPLELLANLSTPGELCLYHTDLPAPQQANTTTTSANATTTNATMITDIAISNPGDEDVTLPSTSTVVIGINEIAKGPHSHEEEGEQAQAGGP